jgi:hypothetical protein
MRNGVNQDDCYALPRSFLDCLSESVDDRLDTVLFNVPVQKLIMVVDHSIVNWQVPLNVFHVLVCPTG